MSSLAAALGLRTSDQQPTAPPSLSASYIIWQFLFAYGILSSRAWKQYYRFDHNVNPREDVAKYGQKAVEAGKLSQKQLNQIKRVESAHANSVEHFPLFVGALIWAHVAGLPIVSINRCGLVYVLARIAYGAVYIFVDTPRLSHLRGIAWWISNVACLRLFWLGGKAINGTI
ncbi:putative membrane- eicosanoid glutathione metabolism protein [Teratosphaeria destructans]|uniref:Membrane- eicosanoid glutathione metabolism protein n=1 Tax=Teratosphaeria destructans TaxID=418781 RepID=A0A9W7VY54_9PEZI|nr:putative membrane- eicosanoid glutathione metabolism protein [Teratosphaeria destructans]